MDALLASLNLGEQPKRRGWAYWKFTPLLLLAFAVMAWIFISLPIEEKGAFVNVEVSSENTNAKNVTVESALSSESKNQENTESNMHIDVTRRTNTLCSLQLNAVHPHA